MKTILASASAAAILTVLAGPAAAQNWSALAGQDLSIAAQELRDNHPAMVVDDRASGAFRSWMDTGLAQTREFLPRANSGNAYAYALRYFANGFRDSNISLEPSWDWERKPWDVAVWPNFATAWRDGKYVVSWVKQGARDMPPIGATLLQCGENTAEEIAQSRIDLFEGDLTQEAERIRTAPYLLWNRSNPLVGGYPTECEFQDGRRKRKFKVLYGPANAVDAEAAYRASAYAAPAVPLAVEQVGNLTWINIHSLDPAAGWDAFYNQLEQSQAQIHQSAGVVIDLRGADGRDPDSIQLGNRAINRIWGGEFVNAQQPATGDLTYRVSQGNRDWYADIVGRMKADEAFAYDYPDAIERTEALVASFDAAIASGQRTITAPVQSLGTARSVLYQEAVAQYEADLAAAEAEAAAQTEAGEVPTDGAQAEAAPAPAPEAPPAPPATNPVTGQVIVLVDGGCSNGCLDLVDTLSNLPNVRIAGQQTSADTIFFDPKRIRLESNYADLSYGLKAWTSRPRPSNQPIQPEVPFTGNPLDENAVRAWVASLIGG